MKIIDPSTSSVLPSQRAKRPLGASNLSSAARKKAPQAIDLAVHALQGVLDSRFFLLRNINLEGPNVVIPLILVGPPGLWVILPSDIKGIFQARENIWEELDSRSRRFKSAKPNLPLQASLMARAVGTYLAEHSVSAPDPEPLLFFSDPGVHVDANRPAARLVLADALERFAAGLSQMPVALEPEVIQNIIRTFAGAFLDQQENQPGVELHDEFSFRDLPAPKSPRQMPRLHFDVPLPRGEPSFARKFSLTRRQWIWLAALLLINFLILIALVVFVWLSA